ncbi:MAG: hypothetical protein ACR2J3_07975 [Aridibacter sp.]
MKNRFSKICFLIFLFPVITFQIIAQNNIKPILVEGYIDGKKDSVKLEKVIDKFLEKLDKSPESTKGYIAFLRGDSFLARHQKRYEEIFDTAKKAVEKENRIKIDDVCGLNSFLQARIEFWLIPKGARIPYNEGICDYECPSLEIQGKKFFKNFDEKLIYNANIEGGVTYIEYKWTVVIGEIVYLYDKPFVEVNFGKTYPQEVKVTVKIEGFPDFCESEKSFISKYSFSKF